jgi:hypothetical protein
MSYQDPNQPYGAPQQQQGQQGQMPMPSGGWGQQGSWGQPGGAPQQSSGQQQLWEAPPQPGYGQGLPGGPQSYPIAPQVYPPQSDFGSGAGYGPDYPIPNPVQRGSGLATTALWLGILGGWGVINLVISILAIRETGPGRKPGRNKAVTGLILTIAWAVVWTGVFVAVSDHASKDLTPVGAPTSVATAAAGAQATGASSDPGCQAAQAAFNTYSANAASGGLGALQTLGNALVSAADESRVAASQLKTTGRDYLELANETTPPNMVTDLEALDSACGMSFTFSG